MFPQGDRWAYDWQVRNLLSVPINPSIVLVTLDETGPEACGKGDWNTSVLARTITALSHAGTELIAPAINFTVPTPGECGGVIGYTNLLEASKQAGIVVYPSTVPEALAREAKTVGLMPLASDGDGVFRRLDPSSFSSDILPQPFGLAIARISPKSWHSSPTVADNSRPASIPHSETDRLVPFAGKWEEQPFPTYSFSLVTDFIAQRSDQRLREIVEGKSVILFPTQGHLESLPTPVDRSAPLGFLHATIFNASLSSSWLSTASVVLAFFSTLLFAFAIALWIQTSRGRWQWATIGILLIIHSCVFGLLFPVSGIVFPLFTQTSVLVLTTVVAFLWSNRENQAWEAAQVRTVEQQLIRTQETLASKELVVEEMEERLQKARDQVEETSQQYAALSTTGDDARIKLREAEEEAERARQHVESLQQELRKLRQVSPVPATALLPVHDLDDRTLQQEAEACGIVTCSPLLMKTFHEVKKAAATNNPILILGETGTGKELFAQAAHRLSSRSQGPFVSVNMAAIRPELFESELFGHVKGAFTGAVSRRGFFEIAHGGSIFLDEIGELPLDLQAKLLRVLENGEFYRVGQSTPTHTDVRIIAATNRDLNQTIEAGQYREDLYYRLRSFLVTLPPLRERGTDDINGLVRKIIDDLSGKIEREPVQITQGAMEAIHAYAWPGNVRELWQTLAQAMALAEGGILTEKDLRLPGGTGQKTKSVAPGRDVRTSPLDGKKALALREDEFVLSMLRKHEFDMKATAKALEWDRSTVTQRLKGMGFQALVAHGSNVQDAAVALAGDSTLEKIVELKLEEYYQNLVSSALEHETEEQALSDCRKRMRNIPERYFPAIESLVRQQFADSSTTRKQSSTPQS
ncbi:MAG: sigma 54-interacting transcriptional regulator [Nitrospirales bacterium]|nr:sigma 54-interacting transcriptional regulator [Nitrospira sp.]MDR4500738.1 sigma 54-interacting transcriptional regulator [Nitrospirales bacterium]